MIVLPVSLLPAIGLRIHPAVPPLQTAPTWEKALVVAASLLYLGFLGFKTGPRLVRAFRRRRHDELPPPFF